MASNQGHCSECDPLTECREEEEKKGAPHDQCREREGERERQGEKERELHSVFSAEELESSLAAEEIQTRYVPDCLVQVGKVMLVIRRSL